MKNYRSALGVVSLTILVAGQPLAAEFAADTLQKGPDGTEMTGRMYVSGDRVRTEMKHNGQEMVQIVDATQGVQWVIMPGQRAYMEQKGQGKIPTTETAGGNPCSAVPGATCRQLGEEPISGRSTIKWEVSLADRQGQRQVAYQWIDKDRSIPLRSEIPGSQKMELRMVGSEKLGGRSVEKWEMTIQQSGQEEQKSLQWYDPELKLAVREEFPGGFVRELRNVQVGKQPADLFQVPAGFQKMAPPPQGQSNPQGR